MSIPLAFVNSLPEPPSNVSLGDSLAKHVTDNGQVKTFFDCFASTTKPALYSPNTMRTPLTHKQIREFVSTFVFPASTSRKRLGPNDRIMVVLPTTPENALALLALASYHTTAPVNATCTAAELFEDAERLGAKAVISTSENVDRLELRNMQEKLGCEIVLLEARSTGPTGLFDMSLLDFPDDITLGDVSDDPQPSQLHGLEDQSLVLHTSGTSGKKKVVPYTLRSLIVGTCAVISSWDLKEEDVNMNMMPLFHVGGIVRNLFAPMLSGGSAIMCAGFDAAAFWSLSTELGSTWYYAAPTMHQAILNSRPDSLVPSRDTKYRLICNAAGGLLPVLAEELKNTFGATILPSYGSTECMPIASPPTTYKLDRPGCSGIACGPYLSIRDPLNLERELPRGQTGAVCVRGLPTFIGYEKVNKIDVPLDTSAFSSEGWFDSGDCGNMDADGYLFITGRSKEIINRGGEVISPFEIEEAVLVVAKERVKGTIAFSVDHDVLQEAIGIVIVPSPEHPRIGLADLQDALKDQLHPSKWPFLVVYMDDLPKNSAGKPLRIKLGPRLGLGQLTDAVPIIQRHYEARAPDKNVPLSEPIPCSRVTLNVDDTDRALRNIDDVKDIATRQQEDGTLDAFVYAEDPNVTSEVVKAELKSVLPGYAIPNSVYMFNKPFPTSNGLPDFESMEEQIKVQNASKMSARALVVRDIVANLLQKDAAMIAGDSDFFLLGGNSLLLGRLSYSIRKETGASLKVSDLFTNSTINGLATLIDTEVNQFMAEASEREQDSSGKGYTEKPLFGEAFRPEETRTARDQSHPLCLIVQALPTLFFYPLKAAWNWSVILLFLAFLTKYLDSSYWSRAVALITSISAARLTSRVICPVAAIIFKWAVIGKYKPGQYEMWSVYYLRWWIVNVSLRTAGRGIFAIHPKGLVLYCRLLGARVGKDVSIANTAALGEYDLLTLEDGCRIDKAVVRGFCVERDSCFRLAPIVIGRNASINTYTQIAPGATIPENTVFGPHASSHEQPSPEHFVGYNRTVFQQPNFFLRTFVAMPIIVVVTFISYIPWLAALAGMIADTSISEAGLNSVEAVLNWFANPTRVGFHILARMLRVVATPLVQVACGIIIKRLMGLNKEGLSEDVTQLTLLRRFINGALLSQYTLRHAFDVLGTHYEMTSIIFRLMGAKIGKRVYWPGSGIYCPDPELLEIGDDVVFGSRSEIFTTDNIGTAKITVGNGAMIADRVVLLPGTHVGKRCVMGSGSLGKRGGVYEDGSTWMGNDGGEAAMFSKGLGVELDEDTITPFGRAFYKREATYFVFPYPLLVLINILISCLSAAWWSLAAVAASQILRQFYIHLPSLNLFAATWYRPATTYGLIASAFVILLTIQSVISLAWVIAWKWIVIRRRKEGSCPWDKSSYCQRWQLHLSLSKPLYRGHGNGGVLGTLTGSAYIVWFYRAIGAKIGKNVCIWAGGRVGLMTEPDLVELGDRVSLDDCSVVAHINSRGMFALNRLNIAMGSAMRTGSRLLSGAQMEDYSMLMEHALLPSGDVAEAGGVYVGWPAKLLDPRRASAVSTLLGSVDNIEKIVSA
ncbi:acetyl-CoA synthetase-like protein [Cytidiella melzeri]|nr:acetyl-CoA synthetase-like protein [Cytidiella melzeri]